MRLLSFVFESVCSHSGFIVATGTQGPLKEVVLKAQVLSGGRGLGTFKNGFKGGVHIISKPGQAKEYAQLMLGQELVTKQAKNGIVCNKILLAERIPVKREMYFSIIMDRKSQGYVFRLIKYVSVLNEKSHISP